MSGLKGGGYGSIGSKDEGPSAVTGSGRFGYVNPKPNSFTASVAFQHDDIGDKSGLGGLGERRMSEADLLPTLRHSRLEHRFRRELYESLPFIAAFGMHQRESTMKRVLSSKSIIALSHLDMQESEHTKLLSNVEVDEITITFALTMAVLMAMISQFLVGFNTSVMNAPEAVVFPGHSTFEWALAVSAFAIGGPFGAIIGGYLANVKGRKGAMMTNMWVFMVGGLMMTCAPSVYWLIPARFVIGFASGLASVVVPVYLGEISPPTLRGTLGTCTQFAMVIGILAADIVAFPLATESLWRVLFFVTPLLCTVQLIASTFLIESPRWLLNRNPHSLEAREAIKRLRGYRHEGDVSQEIHHFLCAAQKHKTSRTSAHSSGAMWDLLTSRRYRRLVVGAIGLQVAQQLCGINAVFYYSTMFFQGIIQDPLVGTALVAFVNVVATFVALWVMDYSHRKTLLLISSGGMIVSTVLLTAALVGVVPNIIALVAVMAFVSFFEIGLGPIPWLIVAEFFDAKYVATAMSIACIVNWGCNFLVGLLFPHIHMLLGPWTFVPFGVVLVASFIFSGLYVTETLGRTVHEVHRVAGVHDDHLFSPGVGSGVEEEASGAGSLDAAVDAVAGLGVGADGLALGGFGSRGGRMRGISFDRDDEGELIMTSIRVDETDDVDGFEPIEYKLQGVEML